MRTLLGLALVLAACGGAATFGPTPTPGRELSPAEQKYRLVDELGRPAFCDPDEHPVARADEADLARERFPEIERDASTLAAILAHERIAAGATLSAEQRVAVYRQWKLLRAVEIGANGSFALPVLAPPDAKTVTRVEGSIDRYGRVTVTRRAPAGPLMCPICLTRGTRIATPDGERAVEDLRVGDAIWTTDATGAKVASTAVAAGSAAAPADHLVARVTLADGRVVGASPGHPDASGRPLGSLRPGDVLDGSRVIAVERVRYGLGRTYDVRAAGPTGGYWADGVLLGSTLR